MAGGRIPVNHQVRMKGVAERRSSQPGFAVPDTLRRAPGQGPAGSRRDPEKLAALPGNVSLLSGGLRAAERPGSCWKPHGQG